MKLILSCNLLEKRGFRSSFLYFINIQVYIYMCVCVCVYVGGIRFVHTSGWDWNEIFVRSSQSNGYRRGKLTYWLSLFVYYLAVITPGKVYIQLFSLQLWVNNRADWGVDPLYGNQSRRKTYLYSNLIPLFLKMNPMSQPAHSWGVRLTTYIDGVTKLNEFLTNSNSK